VIYSNRELLSMQEKPPELALAMDFTIFCTEKSDIWSLGASILQLILDTTVWDGESLAKKFNVKNSSVAIKSVRKNYGYLSCHFILFFPF